MAYDPTSLEFLKRGDLTNLFRYLVYPNGVLLVLLHMVRRASSLVYNVQPKKPLHISLVRLRHNLFRHAIAVVRRKYNFNVRFSQFHRHYFQLLRLFGSNFRPNRSVLGTFKYSRPIPPLY